MEQTLDSAYLKPLAEADSYEEFESLSNQAAPAQQPKAEEKPVETSVPKGETAAAPEAAPAQEQKPKQAQPKRKHDAESRIDELTRKLKERDQQLEDLRKTSVSQESRPAPEARQQPNEPAKLGKLSDYVKAEARRRPEALQEDLIEEWVNKREAEAEQARQVKAGQERINKAMTDFRTKHPEVADAVFQEIILGTPQVNVMKPLMDNFQNWPDVLHYLHENPEVYKQVRSVSPQEQWYDVVAIARMLANGRLPFTAAVTAETPAQEQPRNVRPISRVPAPQRHILGGGISPSGKDPKDARDFEEYEPLERKRMSGGR